ncbi:aminodeoxychorismate synthase component I [bacterium]|nr:aminodeoxychorismate synthase component I [bacterium]
MRMRELPWRHPLACADWLAERGEAEWALFYSSMETSYSGGKSLLAWGVEKRVDGGDWDALSEHLSQYDNEYEHAWFGYLGYGLKNRLEKLPEDVADAAISIGSALPDMQWRRYAHVLVFDHAAKRLFAYSDAPEAMDSLPRAEDAPALAQKTQGHRVVMSSPMTDGEYLVNVGRILEHIAEGDIYQANLTRKYTGHVEGRRWRHFDLFCKLCEVSPAPYSAFLQLGETAILSSSPERFLSMDAKGHIEARPIKGTLRRGDSKADDAALAEKLAHSEKDRAENLMIVDLMRHDLSRIAVPGSVEVPALFEVQPFATVHHMDSTIRAQKRSDIAALDVVKACFPPGSMTGAPKIRAMEICTHLEKYRRGVYSGAIGWFGGDGSMDLSVVIRTLIMQGDRFEFQVGGAIVSDSVPEKELEEVQVKSRGILKALGVL